MWLGLGKAKPEPNPEAVRVTRINLTKMCVFQLLHCNGSFFGVYAHGICNVFEVRCTCIVNLYGDTLKKCNTVD